MAALPSGLFFACRRILLAMQFHSMKPTNQRDAAIIDKGPRAKVTFTGLCLEEFFQPPLTRFNKVIIMRSIVSLLTISCLICGNASALDIAALERAMTNPERPAEDKARDASRRAPVVLDFFGVEPGMTVLDINASTGWYTEVLSYAVGSSGRVLMQNRPDSRAVEAATVRADRLGNVEQIGAISETAPGSVDFAITALNFHDFHNRDPQVARDVLAQTMAALKPGGILGIVDHEGTPGADNAALHRIAFDEVVRAVTAAGFAVIGISQALDNPADDHTLSPTDPSLGRNTDRIVLKLMKI